MHSGILLKNNCLLFSRGKTRFVALLTFHFELLIYLCFDKFRPIWEPFTSVQSTLLPLVKITREWDDFTSCCGVCHLRSSERESARPGWWTNALWDAKNEWRRTALTAHTEVVWDDVWCLHCDCIPGNWRSLCCPLEIYLLDCEILV